MVININKMKEEFLNNKLIYKILPHIVHMCHFLGDPNKSLQVIFQIQKFRNFSVLVIIFRNRSREAGRLFLKSERGFSQ